MALVDLNSAGQISRGQCVTVSAGAGAAYECGDLRLVHALPTISTFGKARAPVLIYNTQHAHPRPIVYADVMLPAGASAPDEVIVTLGLPGDGTESRSFPGSPCCGCARTPGTTSAGTSTGWSTATT